MFRMQTWKFGRNSTLGGQVEGWVLAIWHHPTLPVKGVSSASQITQVSKWFMHPADAQTTRRKKDCLCNCSRAHLPITKAGRRAMLSDTCSEALTTTQYTAQHLESRTVCVCVCNSAKKLLLRCERRASCPPNLCRLARMRSRHRRRCLCALSGGALMKYCRRKVVHTAPRIKIYSPFPTFYWLRRASWKGLHQVGSTIAHFLT